MKKYLFVICLSLVGCIANRVDLVAAKRVQVATHAPEGHSINASVYEQQDGLRVIGQVTKSPLSSIDVRGHVDVEVTDPEGKSISRIRAALHELPAARHMSRSASFAETIPVVPPMGSKVSFTYNLLPHAEFKE